MLIYNENVKKENLKRSLMKRLSNFEFYYFKDAIITSGYRSVEHNKKVGGSPTSSHLIGLAVDIASLNSKDTFYIVESALRAGFVRIGLKDNHVHLDVDPNKEQNVIWLE